MTAAPERLAQALADRYRLERKLGEGGMASVYLAHDLKHDRKVAVKVLKPELAAMLGAERFVVEIKTTAALQHPHILPLFDSGEAGGFLYYVMPFIDGETLRSKLDRETQLGIDEAVRITVAVADALDYAHRHGVIHHDIKPENILLHDGRPMVADFGIALALSAAAGGRMTETGLSLGTPHYMSPEQATAEKELTARSDIYSLGSVCYEMLTGNPPHVGASAQQIIMKIVTEEAAPVTRVRKSVPPHVAAAVAQAIEKLPADRFESARAFADALGDVRYGAGAGTRATAPAAASGARPRWLLPLAALNVVLLLALAALAFRPRPAELPSRQRVLLWRHAFGSILSPGVQRLAAQAALAPDATSIVFADSADGQLRLYRKLRHEGEPVPIAGTEGAISPFFSPDGQWVGFVSGEKLRKVPVAGGGAVTLAEDVNLVYGNAAWLDDGTILYVNQGNQIVRLPAAGGAAVRVEGDSLMIRRTTAAITPLPGSRGFLFTQCPGNCGVASSIYVWDFGADSARLLAKDAAGAWYAPTGHLLYTSREGGLFAAPFDLNAMKLTGGAVPVLEDVEPGTVALAGTGALLYSTGGGLGHASRELTWVARDGSARAVDSTWHARFVYPAIAPDGKAIALSIMEDGTQLWLWRDDRTRQRITQQGTVNWRPHWRADGTALAYLSNATGREGQDAYDAFMVPVDGSAPPVIVADHRFGLWEVEWTRDGQYLVVRADEEGGDGNIRYRRTSGDTALMGLLTGADRTSIFDLSPDGKYIAYSSDADGALEVYVSPFPSVAWRRPISSGGGTEVRWAHSGRELFYKSPTHLMAVPVTTGASFTAGTPRPLFRLDGYIAARNRQQYDVAPGDQRFLMIKDLAGPASENVFYVEDWFTELRAKVKS